MEEDIPRNASVWYIIQSDDHTFQLLLNDGAFYLRCPKNRYKRQGNGYRIRVRNDGEYSVHRIVCDGNSKNENLLIHWCRHCESSDKIPLKFGTYGPHDISYYFRNQMSQSDELCDE